MDATAQFTTQKASAALGAAVIGPLVLEPLISKVIPGKSVADPIVGVVAGAGLVYVGAAFLEGHLESIAIGAGIGLAAKSAIRMFLRVEAPEQ